LDSLAVARFAYGFAISRKTINNKPAAVCGVQAVEK
jgi:hypothetical protein